MPREFFFSHILNKSTLLLQVLPGEVERLEYDGTVQVPNRGDIPANHDSREMVRNNVGVIHVIKDEAQILPYCILHLTGVCHENGPGPLPVSLGQNPNPGVTPRGPMVQQHSMDSQGPMDQQK